MQICCRVHVELQVVRGSFAGARAVKGTLSMVRHGGRKGGLGLAQHDLGAAANLLLACPLGVGWPASDEIPGKLSQGLLARAVRDTDMMARCGLC